MIWGQSDRLVAADRALSGVETLLRSGRFIDLPETVSAMERAMQGLQGSGLDGLAASRLSDLRALRARAANVGELLRAVLSGMRDARASLATPSGFSSYDASGRSGHIGSENTRFERRR
ncbi:hypothetical protein [Nioella aestuarii]|uniref:hypothetical protein n=1 Tax=Nioella aestuarii TaxID=1662864 RepID=UPI003D7FC095